VESLCESLSFFDLFELSLSTFAPELLLDELSFLLDVFALESEFAPAFEVAPELELPPLATPPLPVPLAVLLLVLVTAPEPTVPPVPPVPPLPVPLAVLVPPVTLLVTVGELFEDALGALLFVTAPEPMLPPVLLGFA
jgi:hypothetical protein